MRSSKRQAEAINQIIQEEVQGVLNGRRAAARINERIDQKPVKLDRLQLRRLLSEAFGPFDRSNRYDDDDEVGPMTGISMMPHNFEESHKELFHHALQPIVDEFINALMEIYDAGFPPEGKDHVTAELKTVAEQMREELMKVVEKWTDEGLDRII